MLTDPRQESSRADRQVAASPEWLAYLLVAAAVCGLALALMVGVAGRPAPLLPRQMAVLGALTLGPPAAFLALASGARPGSRSSPALPVRALRFGVPAGAVAAAATFTAYTLADDTVGESRAEARTVAAITLFLVALWLTAILIRRVASRARTLLLCSMAMAFALVMAVPPLREALAFEVVSPLAVVSAAGVTVVATVALELGLQVSGGGQPSTRR